MSTPNQEETEKIHTKEEKVRWLNFLIIDDNYVVVKTIQGILERLYKYAIINSVSDCSQALELLQNTSFYVIFLESLPGISLEECIKSIRYAGCKTPIIVLGLSEIRLTIEQIIGIGVDGIVYKPIHVDEFVQELERVVKHKNDKSGFESSFFKIDKST